MKSTKYAQTTVADIKAAALPREAVGTEAEQEPQKTAEEQFGEDYAQSMRVIFREYSQHEIYYKTLKLVGTTSDEAALNEQILALPEMTVHLRAPRFYLDALYACGALHRDPVSDDSADAHEDQAAGGVTSSSPSDAAGSPVSSDADSQQAEAPAAAIEPMDEEEVAKVAMPKHYIWTLSPVGVQLLKDLAPEQRLHNLLSEDEQALPIYTTILNLCKTPQTRQAVESALNDKKMLEGLGVFTSYFVDRLEQNGGLIWDGAWKTTPEGEVCLEQLGK